MHYSIDFSVVWQGRWNLSKNKIMLHVETACILKKWSTEFWIDQEGKGHVSRNGSIEKVDQSQAAEMQMVRKRRQNG